MKNWISLGVTVFILGLLLSCQLFYPPAFEKLVLGNKSNSSGGQNGEIPTAGLVGEWLFSNGSLSDTSGNQNNGSAAAVSSTPDRFNKTGCALLFNNPMASSVSSMLLNNITISSSPSLNTANMGQFTLNVWVKDLGTYYGSLIRIDGTNSSIDLSVSYNYISLYNQPSSLPSSSSSSTVSLSLGYSTSQLPGWHLISVVIDAMAGSAGLYIDGVFLNSSMGGVDKPVSPAVYIGGSPYGNYYNGILDDVRIYNRALAPYEIQRLYQEGGWSVPPALNSSSAMSFSSTTSTASAGWAIVGPGSLTSAQAQSGQIAFNSSGTPYFAFVDGASGGAISVMYYDSINWSYFGQGISGTTGYQPSIALNTAGKIFLAYRDNSGNIIVMTNSGADPNAWGNYGLTTPGSAPALLVTPNSVPNLAYYNAGAIWVMTNDGTSWISNGSVSVPSLDTFSFANNNAGTLFIAYSDAASFIYVYSNSGGNWYQVGSSFQGSLPSLAFKPSSDVPYIAYQDIMNFNSVSVTSWTSLWANIATSVSPGAADNITLKFDSLGTPYVAFRSDANNKASVVNYITMSYYGSPDFTTTDIIDYLSLAIGPGYTPWVSFSSLITPYAPYVMKQTP